MSAHTTPQVLSYTQQHVYMQRLMRVQAWLHKNKLLATYRFVAPTPTDLVNLAQTRLDTLELFLTSTTAETASSPTHFQWVHPFVLSLKLGHTTQEALEIWIDIPTQSVYLMSNNLFTSAVAQENAFLR